MRRRTLIERLLSKTVAGRVALRSNDRFGFVMLQGWAGLTKQRVQIIGETPKKYRIRALADTRLAGRSRYVLKGSETLVPKHAVVLERPSKRSAREVADDYSTPICRRDD